MGNRIRSGRPSPAMLVSVIALVFALGGVATGLPGKKAVDKNDLAKNVVKSKNIKAGQVKPGDLADVQVVELDLINGWVPYGGADINPPAAFRDGFGVVHLEGGLDRENSTDSDAFRLPAGFRPAAAVYEPVVYDTSGVGHIYIDPNGFVHAFPGTWVSLEGVTFRAAD